MKLHSKILIGLLIGLILGLISNVLFAESESLKWIVNNISNPLGQIFIRMIFMIVIPLIFTAIVLGVADFRDIHKIGVVGLKTLLFTLVITLFFLKSINTINGKKSAIGGFLSIRIFWHSTGEKS